MAAQVKMSDLRPGTLLLDALFTSEISGDVCFWLLVERIDPGDPGGACWYARMWRRWRDQRIAQQRVAVYEDDLLDKKRFTLVSRGEP